jgi:trimeric autotransporter adhesin
MFKNTTRRGLAIGAAIAVAFSGLVTSPAQAAGEVVLAPSAGTSYTTFVTENFTLQASLAPGQVASNAVQLKYKIDKAAGSTVSYAVSTSAPVTQNGTTLNGASTSVVVAAVDASATTQNFIRLSVLNASSVSSSVDVTVTAFLDANNNNTLDAGEFNTPQTVSFKKYSEVSTAVAVNAANELDTTVSGTVSLTGINTNQVQKPVGVVVVLSGTELTSVSATTTFAKTVSPLSASNTISAYVVVNNEKVGANATTVTATAGTVKSVTSSAVAGDNALNSESGKVTARVDSAFVVKGTALNGTTSTASGVAGAAVTVKVTTTGTLTSTQSITLNGTVYTASSALPTALAVTADASGVANVNVATAGLAAGATVTFVFSSQNRNSDNLVATLADAAYTVKATGDTTFRTVASASAFAVDYTVADQWKVALPAGYRLVVAYDGTTKYVPVSAGAAKVEFTSTTSATPQTVTNPNLEKQNTTTLNWATVSAVTASAVTVKATNEAAKFTAAPTHSATASIARATTSNDAGYLSRVTVSGQVNHAGQSVTVTSTGVQFSKADQSTKAVANTITTLADGNGYWTVSAYLTKAGTATFSYVAGAATASTNITVGAAAGSEGTVLTIVSVDTILPGKTLVATLKLTDEHGNPVAADDAAAESFSATVTGLGFVGAIPSKLNANGEATVAVLLGSADEGSVVITATYDQDGAGATKAITTTKTIAVAAAATPEVNAVIGSFNGRWAVRVENAKGSAVVYKVGGRWFKATASSDNFVFSRKSRVGASVLVKVWVNGDLQNEQTITVK